MYVSWNPPRMMEGQFYWALGDLRFSPTCCRAMLNGGFKIFHTFSEGTKDKVC